MPPLTAKRLIQEALAFSLYLWMVQCFCSTLLFATNYSLRKPQGTFLKRFVFPYSVDSDATLYSKFTEHIKGQLTLSSVIINVMLMSLFALQHSLMARQPVRRFLQKVCTKAGERALYVASSSVVLNFVYAFWRPIASSDATLYHLSPIVGGIVDLLFIGGILSTCGCIFEAWYYDQFEIRTAFTGQHFCKHPNEQLTGFHKFVRQPVFGSQIFGLLMARDMSIGRLLFVALLCLYTHIGVIFHEKAVEKEQGEMWRLYKETTSTFFPMKRYWFALAEGKSAVMEWNHKREELYRRQQCTEKKA